jgi:hypothetical protein
MPTETEKMYRQLMEEHGILLRQNEYLKAIIRQLSSDLQMAEDECKALMGQVNAIHS